MYNKPIITNKGYQTIAYYLNNNAKMPIQRMLLSKTDYSSYILETLDLINFNIDLSTNAIATKEKITIKEGGVDVERYALKNVGNYINESVLTAFDIKAVALTCLDENNQEIILAVLTATAPFEKVQDKNTPYVFSMILNLVFTGSEEIKVTTSGYGLITEQQVKNIIGINGSVLTYADLPTPSADNVNQIWRVEDANKKYRSVKIGDTYTWVDSQYSIVKNGANFSNWYYVEEIAQYHENLIKQNVLSTDGICAWTRDNCNNIIQVYGIPDNAIAHNTVFRGNDITELFDSGELSAMIASGNFRGVYLGDYIVKEATADGATCDCFMIADFNQYYEQTDTKNIVIINGYSPKDYQMNTTNTAVGAYQGSAMYKTHLPKWATAVQTAFGSSHILPHYMYCQSNINTTATSWSSLKKGIEDGWRDSDSIQNRIIDLLDEVTVYGGRVFSAGHAYEQTKFALFNYFRPGRSFDKGTLGRKTYWLKNVANSTHFCSCANNGDAGNSSASYLLGLRFFFLLC